MSHQAMHETTILSLVWMRLLKREMYDNRIVLGGLMGHLIFHLTEWLNKLKCYHIKHSPIKCHISHVLLKWFFFVRALSWTCFHLAVALWASILLHHALVLLTSPNQQACCWTHLSLGLTPLLTKSTVDLSSQLPVPHYHPSLTQTPVSQHRLLSPI